MRITSIGHAGLLIQTAAGRIVCDPWFNPAYFASWFPFPDNSWIDPATLADAEYLYVSHLHRDHCDPRWLKQHMSKDTCVLLPDFPVTDLRDELTELGFRNFVQTRNHEPQELPGGLRVMINALTTPTDGPMGDSALSVDDGEVRILNQNDARPVDDTPINAFGPYDAHFLQYSGAIWYPMVYDFPDRMKATVGRRKRQNGMARALRYIETYGARQVFPFAGPPCFLDDDLFHLNDVDSDETNVFPDQLVFLDYLRDHGYDKNAHLFIPGTTAVLGADGACAIEQVPQERVDEIYGPGRRRTYLTAYQERMRPVLAAERASWPRDHSDLVGQLKAWVEPLLEFADHTCSGINGRVLLTVIDDGTEPDAASLAEGVEAVSTAGPGEHIVFDFLTRTVGPWDGVSECRYRFTVARPLIEYCVRHREADWVNELFLSCRFGASRKGPYNEYIYTFFKSLSEERMTYAEGYYAETGEASDFARVGERVIQRHCPHLKADLVRFGTVEDGVLTCQLHGWQFDVSTGRCLTSDDRKLFTRPRDEVENAADYPELASEHS
jgi:UDP-MurNAc hydroxylase